MTELSNIFNNQNLIETNPDETYRFPRSPMAKADQAKLPTQFTCEFASHLLGKYLRGIIEAQWNKWPDYSGIIISRYVALP